MWLQRTATVVAVSLVLATSGGAVARAGDGPLDEAFTGGVLPDGVTTDGVSTDGVVAEDLLPAAPDPLGPAGPLIRRDAPLAWGWGPLRDTVVRYARPAAGAVLRAFAPPSTAFGAGHRGVDLDVAPGDPVFAAADGTVQHAGPVAGRVWVSIAHADGVVTSYGPLAGVTVRHGDRVRRGQRLGRLAPGGHGDGDRDRGLHWGARRGFRYLDPLSLLDAGVPRPSLVGPGGWQGTAHVVTPYEPWEGERWGGLRLAGSPTATAPGFAVPPSPNHLVMVAGLASSTATVPIDPHHLGYPDASVTLLSYAGREVPAHLDPDDPRRDQRAYGPADTWPGIAEAAERLAAQLRAQRRREPGRAVDLVGHSMGGVVIVHYLTHLHDPYDPTLPTIGRVVTIAAPHRGSDLAGAARWVRATPVLGAPVEVIRGWIPGAGPDRLPLDAPAVQQLDPSARAVDTYAEAWRQALAAGVAGPLAMGTEVLAIGGQVDLVVTPGRAALPADLDATVRGRVPELDDGSAADVATDTVLPGGHDGVLRTEAVREVAWRFLAGEEVVEASGGFLANRADDVGLGIHAGAVVAALYGGVLAQLRRLARDPAGAGPVEVTDDLDERVQDGARWTGTRPAG